MEVLEVFGLSFTTALVRGFDTFISILVGVCDISSPLSVLIGDLYTNLSPSSSTTLDILGMDFGNFLIQPLRDIIRDGEDKES